MKIQEITSLNLNEVVFKLSDKSITVKGSNNKTKAVINDIKKLTTLPSNRKFEIHTKYKNNNLNKYSNDLYVDEDTNLYYVVDQKYHETTLKLFNNGFQDEFNNLNNKIQELTSINVNVLFLKVA
jgi:hypothetical protein